MRTSLVNLALCALVVLFQAPLRAQNDHVSTSPVGLANTEGNGKHDFVLGTRVGLRYQQVDHTKRIETEAVAKIGWRRDGVTKDNMAYRARTLRMSVLLGHGELARIDRDLDKNYKIAPTVVVAEKNVSWPDWTLAPIVKPDQWFWVPLDRPWKPNGKDDWLWEVRVRSNTRAGSNYPFDFHRVVPGGVVPGIGSSSSKGRVLGVGCVATGQSRPFELATTFYNHATKFRLRYFAQWGPKSSPAVLHVDLRDPNLGLPGLCGRVRANPVGAADLGMTSSFGTITTRFVDDIPHDPRAIGQKVYLQIAALDRARGGLPVAVTNGIEQVVPADPKLAKIARVYTYASSSGTVRSGPYAGGIVVGFDHD